jgi:predicted permease
LVSLHTADTGYRRDHLLTLLLFPQSGGNKLSNRSAYFRDLAERVGSLPGVASVSYSGSAPANEAEYLLPVYLSPDSPPIQTIDEVIGPEFFATMGMRVLAGREFDWSDDEHSPPVAVVSKKLAEQLYGRENPLGRDLYWSVRSNQQKLKIVGVANNASLWKVESIEPTAVYRPLLQNPDYNEPLLDIRTLVEPGTLKAAAERTLRSLGHHSSLRTATLDERLDGRITAQRLTALLAGFFGIVALLIAAIGLYGLMSFHVTQRTTELAVRLALGAQTWQVFSIVVREVLWIAGIGCTLGLIASMSLRSYVASLIFGISATDPFLLSLAVLILATVALLAGLLPARRAASVDPAVALRKE